MSDISKEQGLPEIIQINKEDFITFDDTLEYLEFDGALSELEYVYFQYKGFVEGCIKGSTDKDGNIKTEKVFPHG